MGIFEAIVWVKDPSIIKVGPVDIRWYGLLFVSGFILGQFLIKKLFKNDNISDKELDKMTMYFIIATIIGARLGHVLFYDAKDYFSNPIEILKIWKGGLASHGAAIAVLFTAWLYAKRSIKWGEKRSFLWVLDKIVIVVAISSCFIRVGNLMNSEILGKQTDKSWGTVFIQNSLDYFNDPYIQEAYNIVDSKVIETGASKSVKVNDKTSMKLQELTISFKTNPKVLQKEEAKSFVRGAISAHDKRVKSEPSQYQHLFIDQGYTLTVNGTPGSFEVEAKLLGIPRHPAQVYEAISGLTLFLILLLIIKKKEKVPEGMLLGVFMIFLFGMRFILEYLKENQSDLILSQDAPMINMGQILSLPLIIMGVVVIYISLKNQKKEAASTDS